MGTPWLMPSPESGYRTLSPADQDRLARLRERATQRMYEAVVGAAQARSVREVERGRDLAAEVMSR